MTDMTPAIVPKSDQLNADSLIAGPITIRITGVEIKAGDQPVSIHYEGDNGLVWRPCKSMVRCLVQLWGPDGKKYVGKSLTLYRDPSIKFGGMQVGGIRISHMSDIGEAMTLALTASKGKKAAFVVKPLVAAAAAAAPAPQSLPTGEQQILASEFAAECSEYAGDVGKLEELGKRVKASRAKLGPLFTSCIDPIIAAFNAAKAAK